MQSDEKQNKENMIVTSGGLIFLAIAALLVTASFLMSPVIQTIFSKYSIGFHHSTKHIYNCRLTLLFCFCCILIIDKFEFYGSDQEQ